MDYFIDVFIPSRTRVFKKLYLKYPWISWMRRRLLGETIRFGVVFKSENGADEYTVEEGPNGSLGVMKGIRDLNYRVLGFSLYVLIHVEGDFLRGWVASEEKIMSRPFSYMVYYGLRTLKRMSFRRS